jgi:adenosylmethionine-8-amino-7-oxononanoate aminotransferase
VLQGAGGMNIIDREALNDLLCHLKQHGVICIADEVMTGFGRTGLLFASDWLHHKPDIICLSKGLTGGTMALGATASTEKIFEAFLDEDPRLTFFHGHSFTANPLACAAAIASLHLLQQEECLAGIEYITQRNRNFVNQFSGHAGIRNLRSLGTILAFEMEREEKKYLSHIKEEVMRLAKAEGILLRPLGNTVYIMPPYCITAIQLEKVMAVLEKIIGMQPGADDQ